MAKRITKAVVISKHIHCGFATFQTGDAFVNIITNSKELDFKPEIGQVIESKKFPGLNGEIIDGVSGDKQYIGIGLESDKYFYDKMLYASRSGLKSLGSMDTYAKTPEFKERVQSYIDKGFIDKGFTKDRDIPEQKAYWEREKLIEQKSQKKKGVVLWMDYEEYKANPALYQGGFSDEVFNSKELYNYVKGGAFGWIGHSGARTAAHDKQIEKGLRKRGISPSKMYNWISSGDGRHFGDSLEGYTKEKQKAKIEARLNEMYNLCIIYSTPSHGGILTDSNRVREEFKKLDVLLPCNKKYNHKEHINNLLSAKEKFSKRTDLNEDERYISDMISEIFANKV
jgi:hypothetical protein